MSSSYSVIPSHINTKSLKDTFCKFTYPERPVFNEDLNMCAPSCDIEQILDPVTGECSNLKVISEKYTELLGSNPTLSFSNIDYIFIIINTVLISVLTYIIDKKIKDNKDIYYIRKYSYYSMLVSYWIMLFFIFFSCRFRKIMSLFLTIITSFSLFTSIKDV